MSQTDLSFSNGVLSISGDLNMQSVPVLWERANEVFEGIETEVTVDLSNVTRSDSAGLALLLECLRIAHRKTVSLRFRSLPVQLQEIARVCELESILPLES